MNLILNKNFELPADGWFQIIPLGVYPFFNGEKKIDQLVDVIACEAIVNRFKTDAQAANFGGILVDYDHFSLDTDKPSEAAGWIVDLQNRTDGVYAQIRWAGEGESKVKSGAYRYVSPVWNSSDCVTVGSALRPMRLATIALTNDPNMKGMKPLSNRSKEPVPAGTGKANIPGNTGGEESNMDYKAELLAVLGLPADATDEQIAAAKAAKACELENACKEKDAMKNRAVTAETKLKDFEHAALIIQVEKDLDDHKAVIANREEVKAQLMVNREGTLKIIKSMRIPEASAITALRNRDGQTPTGQEAIDSAKRTSDQEKYVKEVKIQNRCKTNAEAWQLAATLNPELFKK